MFICKYDLESLFYSFIDCADRHYSNSFLKSCIDIDILNGIDIDSLLCIMID